MQKKDEILPDKIVVTVKGSGIHVETENPSSSFGSLCNPTKDRIIEEVERVINAHQKMDWEKEREGKEEPPMRAAKDLKEGSLVTIDSNGNVYPVHNGIWGGLTLLAQKIKRNKEK